MIEKTVLAVLALFAVAPAAHAAANCTMSKVADLPVTVKNGRPLVAVSINDHPTQLVVNSRNTFSMLSDASAREFNIKTAPSNWQAKGLGGGTASLDAGKADFAFDGARLANIDFLVGGSDLGPGVAGQLGLNILGGTEVEYDLANGVIRFFKATNCQDKALSYWAGSLPFSVVRTTSDQLKAVIAAKINGKSIRVGFDTGLSVSFLSRSAAARAGIAPGGEGVVAGGAIRGIGRAATESSIAPFESFAIGNEEVQHTRLRMANIDIDGADMLLGMDFFLSHRIMFSPRQERLYFTYNGGPVFRFDTPEARPAPDTPKVTEAANLDAPKDAAEFSRRGAASVARRDYAGAITDFTKAAELEPKDARHLLDRARARLGANQPTLAMADLGEVLKLKPDDAEAHQMRGMLYLGGRDMTRARADLDEAIRLSPPEVRMELTVAGLYESADLHEDAIAGYDRWIATHPKDTDTPRALNRRCWARARWGHQLDLALSDCDAALKTGARTSQFYDSRALVKLRLGLLDDSLADYDAALKIQPKNPSALYGRGLARQRKGLKTEGDADIEAAHAILPNLGEEYRKHGITLQSIPAPKPAA